jgi:hypothetical protein
VGAGGGADATPARFLCTRPAYKLSISPTTASTLNVVSASRRVLAPMALRYRSSVNNLPGERGYGHVLEYSAEHLAWQFQRAGFVDYVVDLHDFTHVPHERLDRALATFSAPLRRIPRYRDNLLAVATAP